MSSQQETSTNVRVICRCRPMNKLELSMGGECCVELSDKDVNLQDSNTDNTKTNHKFTFDKCLKPDISQEEVFQIVAEPILQHSMKGLNATIFAYGQTASGKTHTMEGSSLNDYEGRGIIPRVMDRIFEIIDESDENIEFTLKISMLEIYNEKIQDLLDTKKQNLQVKEDKVKGIFVADASEIYVNSSEEMKKIMVLGQGNRSVAATRMNERSSRSHSLFQIMVTQRDQLTGSSKSSKLYFVDLAGSEKIAKTNVKGKQLDEAKNINKSLTALGIVINTLAEAKPGAHIPYRDSKLTRMLTESLGGNSMTTLIIASSMCSYNDKEILSTLRFGQRAKSIKNKPKENIERSTKEQLMLLESTEAKLAVHEMTMSKLKIAINRGDIIGKNFLEQIATDTTLNVTEQSIQSNELVEIKTSDTSRPNIHDMDLFSMDTDTTKEGNKSTNDKTNDSTNEILKVSSTKNIKHSNTDLYQQEETIGDNNNNILPKEDLYDTGFDTNVQDKAVDLLKKKIKKMEDKEEIKILQREKDELNQDINSLKEEVIELKETIKSQNEKLHFYEINYFDQIVQIQQVCEKNFLQTNEFNALLSRLDCELDTLRMISTQVKGFLEEKPVIKFDEDEQEQIKNLMFVNEGENEQEIEAKNIQDFLDIITNNLESCLVKISERSEESIKLPNFEEFCNFIKEMNEKGDNIDSSKLNSYPSMLNNLNFNNISLQDSTNIMDETLISNQPNLLDMTNLNTTKFMMNDSILNTVGNVENNVEQKMQELQNVILLQKKNIEQLRKSEKMNLSEISKLKKKSKKALNIIKTQVEELNVKNNHEKSELRYKIDSLENQVKKTENIVFEKEKINQTVEDTNKLLKVENENQLKTFESIQEEHNEKTKILQLENKIKTLEKVIAKSEKDVLSWKHRLMQKDESINDSVKSLQFLKSTLKLAEDELDYLREYLNKNNQVSVDQILSTKKVKTLRGGGGKDKKIKQKQSTEDMDSGVFTMASKKNQRNIKVVNPERLETIPGEDNQNNANSKPHEFNQDEQNKAENELFEKKNIPDITRFENNKKKKGLFNSNLLNTNKIFTPFKNIFK